MDITNLTPGQLKRAAAIKEKIDALNRELNKFLGGLPTASRAPRKKRTMSAGTKKKIAAAQRKRWANIKRGR
jgi:hypothetical protein